MMKDVFSAWNTFFLSSKTWRVEGCGNLGEMWSSLLQSAPGPSFSWRLRFIYNMSSIQIAEHKWRTNTSLPFILISQVWNIKIDEEQWNIVCEFFVQLIRKLSSRSRIFINFCVPASGTGPRGPPVLRVCHTRVKHNQNMSHQLCHKKIIFSFIFNPGDESGGQQQMFQILKLNYFHKKPMKQHDSQLIICCLNFSNMLELLKHILREFTHDWRIDN